MRIFIIGLCLFTRVEAMEAIHDERPKTRILEKTFLYTDCVDWNGKRWRIEKKLPEYSYSHFDCGSWFIKRATHVYTFRKKELGSPWVLIDRLEYEMFIKENDLLKEAGELPGETDEKDD